MRSLGPLTADDSQGQDLSQYMMLLIQESRKSLPGTGQAGPWLPGKLAADKLWSLGFARFIVEGTGDHAQVPADYLGVLPVHVEVRHRTPALPSPKREASTACAQPMRPAFFALELYPPPGPTLTSCVHRRSVGYGPAPSARAVPQTTVRLAGAAAYSGRMATFVVYSPMKQQPSLSLTACGSKV